MSDHIRKTLEDLMIKVEEQQKAVIETKKLINQLSAYAKQPIPFQDAELQPSGVAVTVKRNAYFGRPLTTCVREFLTMRKSAGLGPANIDEIFAALRDGGYDLETVSAKSESEQKRGVAISVAKNTLAFVKLPTGDWGLLEWYPNIKKRKTADNGTKGNGGEAEPAAAEAEPAAADLGLPPAGDDQATAEAGK